MRIKIRYILTIFVMLGICSCGSSKKVQKQSEVVEIRVDTQSKDSSSVIRKNSTTEIDSIEEDLEITIIEYDTSLPVDSATNKPPIKKEVKVSKRKDNKKSSKEIVEEQQVIQSEHVSETFVKDSVTIESVKEKKETTVPKQISGVVWSVCVLVGLIIILYLVRIFKKNR